MTKLILLALFSTIACCSLEPDQYQKSKDLPAFNVSDILKNSPAKKDPIIGLAEIRKGRYHFACTATVISDKLALTAAHCLVDEDYRIDKDNIKILDLHLQDTGVIAHAGAVNTRADIGVVVGDFSGFNKLPIALNPGGILNAKGPFVTCGFAWGARPLLCTPFIPIQNDMFEEMGQGRLYPGMSGGPVLDIGAGNIIGVNTRVMQHSGVVFTPTVGLLGALELQVIQ